VISAIAQIPATIGRAPIRFAPLGTDPAEPAQADAESDTGVGPTQTQGSANKNPLLRRVRL
jgi:hypothetical protein